MSATAHLGMRRRRVFVAESRALAAPEDCETAASRLSDGPFLFLHLPQLSELAAVIFVVSGVIVLKNY